MSFMRLCVHEGRFLPDVYEAFSSRYTWDEAMRIRAALTVINDEREDFNEWIQENAGELDKIRKRQKRKALKEGADTKTDIDGGPTLETLHKELEENRQGLVNVNAELKKHRAALLQGEEAEGVKSPEEVEFLEEIAHCHAKKIDVLCDAIERKLNPDGATLEEE